MTNFAKTLTVFMLIVFCSTRDAYCWDDVITHRLLAEYASRSSLLVTSDHLRNLGFSKGLDEGLVNGNKMTIIEWIADGAAREDAGFALLAIVGAARYNHHFHNPLLDWSSAGLNDLQLRGQSTVLWSQDSAAQTPIIGGDWSWKKIRQHYKNALESSNEVSRQMYYAKTFQGLGHQIHLVQDMAVPAHVRNDAHPEDPVFGRNALTGAIYFENWIRRNIGTYRELKAFAPILRSPSLLFNVNHSGLNPISQLFDANIYDGYGASAGLNQGLSEYTNSNFFSDDTAFAAERYPSQHNHYFPFPKATSTDLQSYIAGIKSLFQYYAEDKFVDNGIWVSKERDGEAIKFFVRPGRLTRWAHKKYGVGPVFYSTFYRDEQCHEDYAKLLIPRAVGYSAALIDYFFRGSIKIGIPEKGIFASTNNLSQGFRKLSLYAKNVTTNGEEMTGGEIKLVVKYKLALQDPFQSNPVPKSDFNYMVIPHSATTLPRDNAIELAFDLSSSPIPGNAVDISLQLVYYGKLGYEDGAVAVGTFDISEPTPIDVYNNTNWICVNDVWNVSGTPSTVGLVDLNGDHIAYGADEWDVYPHALDFYLKFVYSVDQPFTVSKTDYDYAATNIQPGELNRGIYVLSDKFVDYHFLAIRRPLVAEDQWTHIDFPQGYYGDAIINQEDTSPGMYIIQGKKMWHGTGFIEVNAPFPTTAQCDIRLL